MENMNILEPYSIKHYKGVRDFYPDDMSILRNFLEVSSVTAKNFGFMEYSASPLEFEELYKNKKEDKKLEDIYTKELYTFKDKGGDRVALRPEMTPTLNRMISNIIYNKKFNKNIPIKWFSTPNVFRYETIQKGRSREHYQFNADIIGVKNLWADFEIIVLANSILSNLGLKSDLYTIKINNRESLNECFKDIKLSQEDMNKVFRLLDKKDKIGNKELQKELDKIDKKIFLAFTKFEKEIPKDVKNFISTLSNIGIDVEFDPTIIRGFDYYTGFVFEIFANNSKSKRSICGGGRYDNYIDVNDEYYSGVGFAMGNIVLADMMNENGINKVKKYFNLTIISEVDRIVEINKIQQEILKNNISCNVFYCDSKKSLGTVYKNIEYTTDFILHIDVDFSMNLRLLKTREEDKVNNILEVIKKVKKYV